MYSPARARGQALLLWSLVPASFLAVFYFYPLVRILGYSLAPDGRPIALAWPDLAFLGPVLGFTLGQAAVSTCVTVGLGLPLAWWVKHDRAPGRRVLQILLTIPFVMPAVVMGAAFTALIGPGGLLNRLLMQWLSLSEPPITWLHTFGLIVLAHLVYNVSVAVRIVGSFWSQLDPRLQAAAGTLGASAWRRLLTIDLPLVWPSILSAALLVFQFCFSSFGIILILGGLRFATLEVEIYRQAVSFFNLPLAALLSLLQLIVSFAAMHMYTSLQSASSRALALGEARAQGTWMQAPRALLRWSAVPAFLCAGLLLLPLMALVVQSLTLGDDAWTLRHYTALVAHGDDSAFLASPLTAVGNSLRYGFLTMVLSLLLGLCMAYTLITAPRRLSRWLDPVFLLPLGTSAVTLGLGFILAMGPLRTSVWLVPVAHALIATPFVLRILLPSLRRLQGSLREASAVLGAAPIRTWWHIDRPLLMPAVTVACIFAFMTSLGEFGATLLVARPQHPTMPLIIYRALGQPGLLNLGRALAMSTILMCVSACAMLVLDRLPVALRDF